MKEKGFFLLCYIPGNSPLTSLQRKSCCSLPVTLLLKHVIIIIPSCHLNL